MNLEIFTYKKGNSFINFYPNRGGLITQVNLNGKDLLFLNEETLFDLEKNVRGGIPIMFPNAGPIKNDGKNIKISDLKQHGFARNSVFSYKIKSDNFEMTLKSNSKTKKNYNYKFELKVVGEILNENEIKITKVIKNIGGEDMPISPGFHPYFYISNHEKENIKIVQENYGLIKDYSFCEGNTIILKNYGDIEVENRFKLSFSKNYNNVWIRSESGKDFVCIEPVYKNKNAIIETPLLVKPGEEVKFYIKIKELN